MYDQPGGYVKRVELLDVDPTKHHHMIMSIAPPGQSQRLLFVWSHAAPGYKFPPNSGFYVPRGSRLQLETHYLAGRNNDPNGFRLVMTTKKPKYIAKTAGIEAPQHYINIPPRTTGAKVQASCRVNSGPMDIHAVMVHTHKHGTKVAVSKTGARSSGMVYVGDPRSPQTFNPINPVRVETGDVMTVTCTYDTTNEHDYVRYGVGKDEMCGTYLVYIGKDFSCQQTVPTAAAAGGVPFVSQQQYSSSRTGGRNRGRSGRKRKHRRKKRPGFFMDTMNSVPVHLLSAPAHQPLQFLHRVPVVPVGQVEKSWTWSRVAVGRIQCGIFLSVEDESSATCSTEFVFRRT
jgi:hypothetical protein